MCKHLILATIVCVLAGCTSEEYVGVGTTAASRETGTIAFATRAKTVTRATGAEAAAVLNSNFVVEGVKTIGGSRSEVFDNYSVNWVQNTAYTTASNTADWEYVGQDIATGKTDISEQTIKYWDFAASQYDFWAYSLGGGSATVASLEPDVAAGYTVTGDKTALGKVYISDLQTAYAPSESVTGKPVMGNEVELAFRSLMAKVRVGLYETIPGFSVRNVQFYPAATGTLTTTATLYASSDVLPSVPDGGTSTYTVTFPTTGKSNAGSADYNKAHVTFDPSGTKTSTVAFGTLSYGAKETGKKEVTTGDVWVQRSANSATWAVESGASAGDYSIVMPNEDGEVLTLKVDYTLEAIDGTGETIIVHGATALIPAAYTKWKPNYAYTYLFKISDDTNGFTNPLVTGKSGLYPITLDAVAEGSTDGTQETVTTMATPTITTYSLNSDVATNGGYTTGDDIYVTASTDGEFINMSGMATLYDITGATSFTEAEVLAALNKYTSLTSGTYVGRNGVTLAPVANSLSLSGTTIPLVDGTSITGLTEGQVALIDKSKLTAGHYYAFVYETATGEATTTDKYVAVTPASGTDVSAYYTDNTGTTLATGTADGTTTYYAKYTETNNTYAVKVIKIKS